MNPLFINFIYIISAALFIFGLKMLSSPATARRGNLLSSLGMLIAIIVTLMNAGLDYKWIFLGILIGSGIGALSQFESK
ncbi:NAD(P) transhydrogenase beta subunit [Candidatus Electrothrix communis]|uniref:NAD(P) transhydrogenase beta subunit n=1 Tax=Candidatus Electrothrix communis TaxID=1859133 RepID=A0A444IVT6_9BACT|nr:NAD(P) transhydrogenase beta subunit [Candidatus Electrothrix communis]